MPQQKTRLKLDARNPTPESLAIYRKRIKYLCNKYQNALDPEDAFQEVYMTMLARKGGNSTVEQMFIDAMRTYFGRVSQRTPKRSKNPKTKRFYTKQREPKLRNVQLYTIEDLPESVFDDHEEQTALTERNIEIDRYIDMLDGQDKIIAALIIYYGYSKREIGELFGFTASWVPACALQTEPMKELFKLLKENSAA